MLQRGRMRSPERMAAQLRRDYEKITAKERAWTGYVQSSDPSTRLWWYQVYALISAKPEHPRHVRAEKERMRRVYGGASIPANRMED